MEGSSSLSISVGLCCHIQPDTALLCKVMHIPCCKFPKRRSGWSFHHIASVKCGFFYRYKVPQFHWPAVSLVSVAHEMQLKCRGKQLPLFCRFVRFAFFFSSAILFTFSPLNLFPSKIMGKKNKKCYQKLFCNLYKFV